MKNFKGNGYINRDEVGTFEILCFYCKNPVMRRFEKKVQVAKNPDKFEIHRGMKRLGEYNRMRVVLSDGSFMEPFVCTGCRAQAEKEVDTDTTARKDIIDLVKKEEGHDFDFQGRPPQHKQEALSKWDSIEALKTVPYEEKTEISHGRSIEIAKTHKEEKEKK